MRDDDRPRPAKRGGPPTVDPAGPQRPVKVRIGPTAERVLTQAHGTLHAGIRAAIDAEVARRTIPANPPNSVPPD